MKLKKLFVIFFSIEIFSLIILGLAAFLMLQNQEMLIKNQEMHFKSYEVATELRQNSDDLTRYCRTYVSTGDSIWEKKYWDVLDIREGKKPWANGSVISLVDSIKKLNPTDAELAKLKEAEENSNKLVWTERVVFNAMKGLFDDGTGHFSIKGKPDKEMARRIIYDEKYHNDKIKIVQPIDDFIAMVRKRTAVNLERNNSISYTILTVILGLVILVSIIAATAYFMIKDKLIKQLEELSQASKIVEEREELVRLFMDNIPGLAYVKDENLRIVFANKGFQDYADIGAESLTNKSAYERWPAEYAAKIEKDDRWVLNSEKSYTTEDKFYNTIWLSQRFFIPHLSGQPMLGCIAIDITEQKKAEEALRKSEQEYRKVINNIHDVFYRTDENSIITFASPSAFRLMGYDSSEELIGKDIKILWAYPERRKDMLDKIKQEGKVVDYEVLLKRRDGSHVYASVSSAVLRNSEGSYIGVEGIFRDITRRKIVEEELYKNQSLLRKAQEIAHVGNWEIDLETFTVEGSEEAARIYGIEPKGFTTSLAVVQRTILLKYRAKLDDAMKALISSKKEYSEEYQIQRINDGALRWLYSKAELVVDSAGLPLKISGIVQDITERKSVEDALRESEKKFLTIFRTSLITTSITSLITHKYIDINDLFVFYTGYTREEVIGRTMEELNLFVSENDRMFLLDEVEKNGFINGQEVQLRMKHGEIRSIILSARVIDTNDGPCLLSTAVDITEQKQTEARLAEYAKELKELNKTKDKFFSILAHDLKNPFQALLGYSNILSKEYYALSEDEKISFINNIEELGTNTFKLLENLLEWSRIQTGRIALNEEEFYLNLELNQTLSLLKQAALSKNINFTETIDKSYMVKADKNMLSTIVRNLVSNSIKFTNSGGKVKLNAKKIDGFIEISITDTGVGIEKENLNKLFKIDKSISTRGTADEKGTGLGLVLCKEMVEKHGGKIWVESKTGEGSAFYFTLPAC